MSKLSRRNFLRTTLYSAAAAGAVSPMIVRAQDEVAANDKINCAVKVVLQLMRYSPNLRICHFWGIDSASQSAASMIRIPSC